MSVFTFDIAAAMKYYFERLTALSINSHPFSATQVNDDAATTTQNGERGRESKGI